MSFSETIPEDEILQDIYEKMIFNEFHKKTKQLKQGVYRSPGLPLR